ncbi:acetylxylan esterase [Kitasatospora sp. NPDC048365]|uniref:acetylxylan esterase n=1 Tax=Kitasatospora sp. NPDC048365 TaxID=3364050 RepID=UPI00371F46ED
MPLTDLPLEQLLAYRPEVDAPADLDAFWAGTLAAARAAGGSARLLPVEGSPLTGVDVWDVRFPGWRGEPVAGWLLAPRGAPGPLPVVVEYLGYSQGRGLPLEHLLYPAAGWAVFVMDSRGQGHETPDAHEGPAAQWVGGFMTKGVDAPQHHYYRRLYADAVRAVDFVRGLDGLVDPGRVVVAGNSQGGGVALAVAALADGLVAGAMVNVPFLQHFRRSVEIAGDGPYPEVAEYLRFHTPGAVERTFRTLSYFDGVNLAARAGAPALFSVALMDPVCPPSTVYAAYHRYAGPKEMAVWPFADHAGGRAAQLDRQLRWLARLTGHAGADGVDQRP